MAEINQEKIDAINELYNIYMLDPSAFDEEQANAIKEARGLIDDTTGFKPLPSIKDTFKKPITEPAIQDTFKDEEPVVPIKLPKADVIEKEVKPVEPVKEYRARADYPEGFFDSRENVSDLGSFIHHYAPETENPTKSYIDSISSQLGVAPDIPFHRIDADELVPLIAKQEGYGKPNKPATRNNNPGNLEFRGQPLAIGKDSQGFAIFASPQDGVEALINQINEDQRRSREWYEKETDMALQNHWNDLYQKYYDQKTKKKDAEPTLLEIGLGASSQSISSGLVSNAIDNEVLLAKEDAMKPLVVDGKNVAIVKVRPDGSVFEPSHTPGIDHLNYVPVIGDARSKIKYSDKRRDLEKEGYRILNLDTQQLEPTFRDLEDIQHGAVSADKKGFMDVMHDAWEDPAKYAPVVGSYYEGEELWKIFTAAKKLENANGDMKALSDDEIELLYDFVLDNETERDFGGKVAEVLVNMPSFAGEIALTGGALTAGKWVTKKIITKGLKEGLEKQIKDRLIVRGVKKTVEVGIQTIAGSNIAISPKADGSWGFSGRIDNTVIKKILPGLETATSGNANLITITGPGMDLGKAESQAILEIYGEFLSEMTGKGAMKAVKWVHGKTLKKLFNQIEKLPGADAIKRTLANNALINTLKKANPNASVSDLQKIAERFGYHGIFEEMLEERVNDAFQQIAFTASDLGIVSDDFDNPNYQWNLTMEQLAVEFTAFTIPGGAVKSGQYLLNYSSDKRWNNSTIGKKIAEAREIGVPEEELEGKSEEDKKITRARYEQSLFMFEFFARRNPEMYDKHFMVDLIPQLNEITKEELEKMGLSMEGEGLDADTQVARILGSTEYKTFEKNAKVLISLYQGADASTTVEEWYGANYKSLSEEEKNNFQQYYEKYITDSSFRAEVNERISKVEGEHFNKDSVLKPQELFEKDGKAHFFEGGVLYQDSYVGSIYRRLRDMFDRLFTIGTVDKSVEKIYRDVGVGEKIVEAKDIEADEVQEIPAEEAPAEDKPKREPITVGEQDLVWDEETQSYIAKEEEDKDKPSFQLAPKKSVLDVAKELGAGKTEPKNEDKVSIAVVKGIRDVVKSLEDENIDLHATLEWYFDSMDKAQDIAMNEVPIESSTDALLFRTILALQSQGAKPEIQYNTTIGSYGYYKDNGTFNYNPSPNTGKEVLWSANIKDKDVMVGGMESGAVYKNHKKLEALIEKFGQEKAMEFIITKHTGRELVGLMKELGMPKPNVRVGDEYYGARVFGPKIGAFTMNLNGVSDIATYDRWWVRTWNRWMGTPTFIQKGEEKVQGTPRGLPEEDLMNEAIAEIAKELTEATGYNWTPPAVQAVLWYYEKALYIKHGASVPEGEDYLGSAKIRAKEKGYATTPRGDKAVRGIKRRRSVTTGKDIASLEKAPSKIRKKDKEKAPQVSYQLEPTGLKKLYHVTPKANISKIKKEGLLPFQTTLWVDPDGNRQGGGEIYAFESLKDAEKWKLKLLYDLDFESSILEIDNKDDRWNEDVVVFPDGTIIPKNIIGPDDGRWFKRHQSIPAENIKVLKDTKPSFQLTPTQKEFFEDAQPEMYDDDGNLKVFLHGTTAPEFDQFDSSFLGSGTGMRSYGFNFTDNRTIASFYTMRGKNPWKDDSKGLRRVIPVYLNLKNAPVYDLKGEKFDTAFHWIGYKYANWVQLQEMHYKGKEFRDDRTSGKTILKFPKSDGIIFKNTVEAEINGKKEVGTTVIVFNPDAIKSIYNPNPKPSPSFQLAPAQKEFFEDTKVVDKNGEPRVVYHGTAEYFDEVEFNQGGWFAENPNIANAYSRFEVGFSEGEGLSPKILPSYLNIKNPLDFNKAFDDAKQQYTWKEFSDFLESKTGKKPPKPERVNFLELPGNDPVAFEFAELITSFREGYPPLRDWVMSFGYDGLKMNEGVWDEKSQKQRDDQTWYAFKPEQVKSVYNVNPKEDPKKSFQLEPKPKMFSTAETVADKIEAKSMKAQGIIPYFKRFGVKDDELYWLGLDVWLEDNFKPTEKVSVEQIQEFIRQNKVVFKVGSLDENQVIVESEEEYEIENLKSYNAKVVPLTEYETYTVTGAEDSDYRVIVITLPKKEGDIYTSRHFNQVKNPVAHIRVTTRYNTKGEKVLYVEEVQSDWNSSAFKIRERRVKEIAQEFIKDNKINPKTKKPFTDSLEDWRDAKALADKKVPQHFGYISRELEASIKNERIRKEFHEMIQAQLVDNLLTINRAIGDGSYEYIFGDLSELEGIKGLEAFIGIEGASELISSEEHPLHNPFADYGLWKDSMIFENEQDYEVQYQIRVMELVDNVMEKTGFSKEKAQKYVNGFLKIPLKKNTFFKGLATNETGLPGDMHKFLLSSFDENATIGDAIRLFISQIIEGRKATEEWQRQKVMFGDNAKPENPYKESKKSKPWMDLAIKRIIMYGAENGFDRIAWSDGDFQLKVNNVRRVLSRIDYKRIKGTNQYIIRLYDLNGNIKKHAEIKDIMTTAELDDYLPSEVVDRIERGEGKKVDAPEGVGTSKLTEKGTTFKPDADKWTSLEDGNLDASPVYHRMLYEEYMPGGFKRIGKGLGVGVETTTLEISGELGDRMPDDADYLEPTLDSRWMSKKEVNDLFEGADIGDHHKHFIKGFHRFREVDLAFENLVWVVAENKETGKYSSWRIEEEDGIKEINDISSNASWEDIVKSLIGEEVDARIDRKSIPLSEELKSKVFNEGLPSFQLSPKSKPLDVYKDINPKNIKTASEGDKDFNQREHKIIPISTILKRISPKIYHALLRLQFNVSVKQNNARDRINDFRKKVNKMSKKDQAIFKLAMLNSDYDTMIPLINKYDMHTEFAEARLVLEEIRNGLIGVGEDVGYIDNYFPRKILNLQGLRQSLNQDAPTKTFIDSQIEQREQDLGRRLTSEEEIDLINKLIRGYSYIKSKPSFLKGRKLEQITADQMEFYEDPIAQLGRHIDISIERIENKKFLGFADASEESIGTYIQRLRDSGMEISDADEKKMFDVLSAYFNYQPIGGMIGNVKTLAYGILLSRFTNAVTQVQDQVYSVYENGWNQVRTIKNILRYLFRMKRIKRTDIGVEKIAQELDFSLEGKGWQGRLTKLISGGVDLVFTFSGFKAMDGMGKSNIINSAIQRYRAKAKKNRLSKKDKDYLKSLVGEEYDQLIEDLKLAGDSPTTLELFLAYARLLHYQPVGRTEVPLAYLESGAIGRMFYMLKTFGIKQLNVLRDEGWDIISGKQKGNKIKATANLMYLGALVVLAGAGGDELKEWMKGKKSRFSEKIEDNLLKIILVNKYFTDKIRREAVYKGVITSFIENVQKNFFQLTAPTVLAEVLDALMREVYKEEDAKPNKGTRYIPLIGDLLYTRRDLSEAVGIGGGGRDSYVRYRLNDYYKATYDKDTKKRIQGALLDWEIDEYIELIEDARKYDVPRVAWEKHKKHVRGLRKSKRQ